MKLLATEEIKKGVLYPMARLYDQIFMLIQISTLFQQLMASLHRHSITYQYPHLIDMSLSLILPTLLRILVILTPLISPMLQNLPVSFHRLRAPPQFLLAPQLKPLKPLLNSGLTKLSLRPALFQLLSIAGMMALNLKLSYKTYLLSAFLSPLILRLHRFF